MATIPYRTALIVGAGTGISASVARALAASGLKIGLAARDIDKLAPLSAETGAARFAADASDPEAVARLFEEADARLGALNVVLYNPAPGRPVRSPRSTRPRPARRSRYRRMAASSSCSRRLGG
jgi:NAD(P)-dependent dehydrogenase (short-subunit alcohol dehydrogenase family)